MTEAQAARYLAVLGVDARPPSLAALTGLVTAHLARVPFENVSKLVRHGRGERPGLPDLDRFLGGVEHARLGGTCYACAGYLNALLRSLGYDAALRGAAMARPDVHAVNVVRLEDRDWLVDVGYGAPFFAPLPLDAREPVAVSLADEQWVVHPRDARGRTRVDHRRDGALVHGYTVAPAPRDLDHFAPAIVDSFRPDAEFLNRLRIVRHAPERSVMVSDRRVTVITGGVVRTRALPGWQDVAGVVEALLGIPARTTMEAARVLE